MTTHLRRILASTLLAGTALLSGPSLAESPALTAEQWAADLDAFLTVLHTEHEDPYFHTPKVEFDATVAEYRAALPALNRAERVTGLARIVALVGDGHTWMPMHALPFEGMPPGPRFRSLPVRLDVFEEGVFIVGAVDSDLAGARVTSIGGATAAEAVARTMALLPTDAVNFSRELLPEWLMQAELLAALGLARSADEIHLKIEQNGAVREITLEPLAPESRYDWVFSQDDGPVDATGWTTAGGVPPLWRERVDGAWRTVALEEAVYLQINQIQDAAQSYAEMAAAAVALTATLETPALVIDLRRCLGGDGTLNAGLMAALTGSEALMLPGRLAVLTGRQTHSAAVMLVSDLEQQTPARFYGQGTADRPNHHGETNIFLTPNSQLPILHASEYYQTSFESDDRRFRTPDIAIPYRFSDYIAGADPVLDAALSDFGGGP